MTSIVRISLFRVFAIAGISCALFACLFPPSLAAQSNSKDADTTQHMVITNLLQELGHTRTPRQAAISPGGRIVDWVAPADLAVDGTFRYPGQYAELQPGANATTIKISRPSRAAMVNEFFNTTAFVNPSNKPLGTYGNSSQGMISGPAYANTDGSVLKDFTLPQTFRLQFRAESFNTFNQVNFANPNTYANAGSAFGQI